MKRLMDSVHHLLLFQLFHGCQRVSSEDVAVDSFQKAVRDMLPAPHMADIFDIKGPLGIATGPDFGVWFIMAAALALLAAASLVIRIRAGKKKAPASGPSPAESACRKLEAIRGLMDENGREFYFQLSLIFREYLLDRFGVRAPEMTTQELLPRIDRLKLEAEWKKRIRDFFDGGDLVKYARATSVRDERETHLKMVSQFIEITVPIEAAGPNRERSDDSESMRAKNAPECGSLEGTTGKD